jgi:hypothetical protein
MCGCVCGAARVQSLLSLFAEVHCWDKFQGKFLVPFYAADIVASQKDRLRIVREHVILVVREYNQVCVRVRVSGCVCGCGWV